MLFNEIYGNYYNTVAEILKYAVRGELTQQDIYEITDSKAFAESVLSIPGAMNSGEWPFLTEELTTPLQHEPKMPLTTLQKRWLKALLDDPRIRLFDVPAEGLEDVEPLYRSGAIVYFDQYSDGDPYEDENYVRNFRTALQAIREHRKLQVNFRGGSGREHRWVCVPLSMEYSLKDDKFRLIVCGVEDNNIINIARIKKCTLLEEYAPEEVSEISARKKKLVIELTDERNALERVMLHFSHLRKETMKLDDKTYQISLWYDRDDETELLIRVLSFGPVLKVQEPKNFIRQIRKRLEMQKRFE